MTLCTFLEESASASTMIEFLRSLSTGLSNLKDNRNAKYQVWGFLWDRSGLLPSGLSCIGIKSICLHSHFLYIKEHICIGKRSLIVTWTLIIQSIFDPVFANQDRLIFTASSNALQQNLEILSVAISEVKIELGQRALCFHLK